jgi:CheY-like chemotaxis protein
MSTVMHEEKPIALIVEDKEETLETRSRLFNAYGFQSIGAKSVPDALREFRSTPAIDIVVADINLDEGLEHDKSGVVLARMIRERRPTLPLMGLSAREDLDEEEMQPFNDFLEKGAFTYDELTTKMDVWRNEALQYRRSRAEKAKSELARMRQEQPMTQPDVEILRDFLPGSHLVSNTAEENDFLTPDEILRRAGWRLRLVEAGSELSPTIARTTMTIPIWLQQDESITIAVLHGHPCIYHDASTEAEAIAGAVELMFRYHSQFLSEPESQLSNELEQLRNYLTKVFL